MKASKHLKAGVIAVGSWVEHTNDAIPDLCICDPKSMGQSGLTDKQVRERARRIAACWNACDGISTEALERCYPTHPNEIDQLQIQHDDLLTALQGALESMESGVTSLGVIRAARAAIAKATGGRA